MSLGAPAAWTGLGSWGPGPSDCRVSAGAGSGLAALLARNEWSAEPGVSEDEPVIIFKFAIIDLGTSYCDKNELIIKFISEINSAAIKQLAGAAGAAGGPAFPAAKAAAQPGLTPQAAGARVTVLSPCLGPLFPCGRGIGSVPGGGGGPGPAMRPEPRLPGRRPPLPPVRPPRVPGCAAWRGARTQGRRGRGGGE